MNTTKKLMTLLLAMLLMGGGIAAQAQDKQEKQEVVKLKNGHQVRGKIVTYAPLDSLVIQEDDGTLQTIYWDKIKQITKEKWKPQQTMGSSFTPGKGPQKGYRGFVDVEYYYSNDEVSENHYGFSTSHGFQLKPWLFVGAGAGMKISHKKHRTDLRTPKEDIYMFPVFADIRLDLLKSKFTPFLDCRVGYTLGNKAFGLMVNPSLGCRIGLTNKLAINASLGYSFQSTDLIALDYGDTVIKHLDNNNAGYIYMENDPYHCLSFKLGIEF
ncbi:MAG: hypothetical protein IJK93_09090 [Muribaculaceae bacterium]|nr:hypothetical protein [Muribaculaceae bacterium]